MLPYFINSGIEVSRRANTPISLTSTVHNKRKLETFMANKPINNNENMLHLLQHEALFQVVIINMLIKIGTISWLEFHS